MEDFKSLAKKKILSTIKEIKSEWKVLIMDKVCMRTISSICGMFDIMEQGVTLVDDIFKTREPMPNMDAIYFLTPTKESIDAFLKEGEGQYSNIHLLFSSTLPNAFIQSIKESKFALGRRIKTLKEIHFEFIGYEQRVFHFDEENCFKTLYSSQNQNKKSDFIKEAARKLTGLFITLGEHPVIRYQRNSPLSKEVATNLAKNLVEYSNKSSNYPEKASKPVFLLLERTIDFISCFTHELSYQAMLKEIFGLKNDQYEMEEGEEKRVVLLNEGDPLWPKLRHLYIGDAINYVVETFKEFSAEARKFDTQELKNISDMQTAIKNLPKITELKSRYAVHIQISKECSNKFNDNMRTIITKEQEFATQMDFKNVKIKSSARLSSLKELLANKNLDEGNRARLLLIHIASEGGIDKKDRASLEEAAAFGAKPKRALDVLLNLIDKNPIKVEPYKKINKKEVSNTAEFYRYKPLLLNILGNLKNNELSKDDFPFLDSKEASLLEVKPKQENSAPTNLKAASLKGGGNKNTNSAWKNRKKEDAEGAKESSSSGETRYIVFILGGATFSETRSAYEISEELKCDVTLGSNFIFSGREFFHQFSYLD